jgi:multidrug efflux pump subunit AcrA (membrane-fusion protein)
MQRHFGVTPQVVDQQQAKVDQVIAMIDADQAMIETAQTNLDYTSIVAPSDGRMGVRLIDPGNIVRGIPQPPGPSQASAGVGDRYSPAAKQFLFEV